MGTVRRSEYGRIRLLAAAALVVTAIPVGAAAAPAGPCPNRVTTTKDGWRRIAVPPSDESPYVTTAYAVDPLSPSTIYTTNGSAVSLTTDGGCTWRRVYEVATGPSLDNPLALPGGRVAEVVTARNQVFLLLVDPTAARVLASRDRGASWTTAELPMAQSLVSRPPKLVTDVTGTFVYALTFPGEAFRVGRDELFFASEDGGATWSARTIDPTLLPVSGVRDVAVDPQTGSTVYVTTAGALLKSTDAGATWEASYRTERLDFENVAVVHRSGRPVQVAITSANEGLVRVLTPVGEWIAINTPDRVTSAIGGRDGRQVAITTEHGTYELDYDSLTWGDVHDGSPTLSRLTTDYTAAPMIYACACDDDGSLWSRVPRSARTDADPGIVPQDPDFPGFYGCADDGRRPEPASFRESAVEPGAKEVVLAPGQSKQVTYTFRVKPRELDLFFLVDTGQRAAEFGCAASQGGVWAAEQLARTRNVRAGVGQYRDNQPALLDEGVIMIVGPQCVERIPNEFVYRRELRVSPIDGLFRSRMARARWDGSCSGDLAGLTGLMQAATGSGQDVAPNGPSPWDVAAGQQAAFDTHAYKVVVHVAGADFLQRRYDEPRYEHVVQALTANGIKQVGVGFAPLLKKKDHGSGDGYEFRRDLAATAALRKVAVDTDAVATQAVTCAGRVKSKIRPGEPLVCPYTDDASDDPKRGKKVNEPPMGRLVVDLVGSMTDPRRMSVSMLPGSDRGVAALAGSARVLDHLREQSLRYTVTYKCAKADEGKSRTVRLGGHVGTETVATATTTVHCGTPPPPVPPPPRRPFEFFPLPGLVVPVAAPAAPQLPPQNLAPNTAPQPNGNPQQLPNAAGGMAFEAEQQPRLAYADSQDHSKQIQVDELAMSALPRPDPYRVPPWAVVGVAGAMTCAAGAFALRRSRTASARVRVQRC